jgi:Rrf2 family nitric oxide-sensitive transcriptional repressor
MQLQLTKRTDYAIRACIHLAVEGRCPIPSRRIAAEMAIPDRFLPQVMADLSRAGIVGAVAGKRGGYCLRRPPADVTLLDVVRATRSSQRRERCVMRDAPCDADPSCALHAVLGTAEASYIEVLDRTSLADLAAQQRAAQEQHGRERPERTER